MNKKIVGIIIIILFIGVGFVSNVYADNIYTNKNVSSIDIESNIIAYWTFDEGIGNIVRDSSGNGYDGTVYGADWVSGHSGTALEFKDSSDMVIGISSSLDNKFSDYCSIECWIYWYGLTGTRHEIFDSRSGTSNYGSGFHFNINKTGYLRFITYTTSGAYRLSSQNMIPTNKWTHVKGVYDYDSQKLSLYINNVLDGELSYSVPYLDSYDSKAIGNNHWAPGDGEWRPFNGVIDELKLCWFENNPPNEPSVVYKRLDDEIVITATDPDGDFIRYGISWENDEEVDQYTGYVSSGIEQIINCNGRNGIVGVIAEDEYGALSDWVLVKSKDKVMEYQIKSVFFERFLQLFPFFENILYQIKL